MSRLEQSVSERIEMLRYPLILGVVWIHSFPSTATIGSVTVGLEKPGPLFDIPRQLISQGLGRLAVPFLFFFAGYLFFLGGKPQNTVKSWWDFFAKKWKSRIKSLVIPYLFWNLFAILMLLIGNALFVHAPLPDWGILRFLDVWLGLSSYPMNYPFWFIRNLILLALLSPLLYVLIKRLPWLVLTMGMVWILTLWRFRIPDSPGLFFFSLGALLSIHEIDLRRLDRFRWIFLGLYVLTLGNDLLHKGEMYSENWHRLGIAFGLLTLWTWTSQWVQNKSFTSTLIALAPGSFFLFALHEPALTWFRKSIFFAIKPESEALLLILYIVIPLVLVVAWHRLYLTLQRSIPKALAVVTGGR